MRDPEYWYWRAAHLQLSGQTANALAEFQRVAESSAEANLKARAYLQAAEVLQQAGQQTEALDQLAHIASLDTESVLVEQSYLQRIRLLTGEQKLTEARFLIDQFRERFPASKLLSEVTRLQGESHLNEQQFQDAIETLRELAEANMAHDGSASKTDQNVTWYQLARAYYQARQYPEALAALKQIDRSGLPPGMRARVEYAEGSIYWQLKQGDDALQALDRALSSDPNSTFANRVRWKRMLVLTTERRWEEGIAAYQEWEPTDDGTWFYRQAGRFFAESVYAAGHYDFASSAFALLLSHLPSDMDSAYGVSGLAWCCLRQEKWSTAAELFRRVTDQFGSDPQAPAAMLGCAYSLEMLGESRQATDVYRQFIQRFPEHPERWRAHLRAAELLRDSAPSPMPFGSWKKACQLSIATKHASVCGT